MNITSQKSILFFAVPLILAAQLAVCAPAETQNITIISPQLIKSIFHSKLKSLFGPRSSSTTTSTTPRSLNNDWETTLQRPTEDPNATPKIYLNIDGRIMEYPLYEIIGGLFLFALMMCSLFIGCAFLARIVLNSYRSY